MMLPTPGWWNDRGAPAIALLPLAWMYDFARRLRQHWTTPVDIGIPVICVGNITAGGAGKTPVALYIGKLLAERGVRAFFLSRGYGGRVAGPLLVNPRRHEASEVGDEPLLLAELLPTVVAKHRADGARFALSQGAEVLIMDDGLQNPSLAKTLSLAVVDGTFGFGNGLLFPAGPLRLPVAEGMAMANAVVAINAGEGFFIPQAKRLFSAITQPVHAEFIKDKRWVAFCGIAYPQKFFATLHNLGAHVMATRAFADHAPYSPQEIERLRRQAAAHGASLITTAKDMARIPPSHRHDIAVLNIALTFGEEAAFAEFLLSAVGRT